MSDERIPIDQLMDLVEGSLPEDEAARLEAALDDDGRRELAVQDAVRTVLGQLPGPALSDDERQRLRAAVRAELRVEETIPAPSRDRREQRSWLVRVLPSAAAAVSVVAMIAVAINLVGGADSVQEPSLTESGAAVTEQAAEVARAPASAPAAEAPDDAGDPVALAEEATVEQAADAAMADVAMEADAAAELAEAAMAEAAMEEALAEPEEPEALAETSPAASDAEKGQALGPGYVAFEVTTDRPEETREMMEALVAVSEMAPVPVAELADRAAEEELVCWQGAAELAGASGVIIWMAPGLVDGLAGEAYLVAPGPDDQPGTGVLALFVYPNCRAVALRAVTDGG